MWLVITFMHLIIKLLLLLLLLLLSLSGWDATGWMLWSPESAWQLVDGICTRTLSCWNAAS